VASAEGSLAALSGSARRARGSASRSRPWSTRSACEDGVGSTSTGEDRVGQGVPRRADSRSCGRRLAEPLRPETEAALAAGATRGTAQPRIDRFHRRGRSAVVSEWRLINATHNLTGPPERNGRASSGLSALRTRERGTANEVATARQTRRERVFLHHPLPSLSLSTAAQPRAHARGGRTVSRNRDEYVVG
jgi:hypothetical protein